MGLLYQTDYRDRRKKKKESTDFTLKPSDDVPYHLVLLIMLKLKALAASPLLLQVKVLKF